MSDYDNKPVVYNRSMQRLAILDLASNIGYEQIYNGLWTAYFELPADDEKTTHCQPMYYVEINDNGLRVGLFRIINRDTIRKPDGTVIAYQLEHVLASLMDSVLYGYHEIGGLGVYTTDILTYILGQQNTTDWVLGQVDFTRQFQYSWEHENLLAAMFSVPRPFDVDYRWVFDTHSYPWTISLRTAITSLGPEITYEHNLKEITKTEDPHNLCTRLYALGQGEGVNQLNIKDVNPTGEAYIDADTIGTYGLITRVWVDRRYESDETLYEAAVAQLEQIKSPRIEIKVNASDVYKLTREPIDKFELGRLCTINDEDLGISYQARIIKLSKSDMIGDPGNIEIELANRPQDVAGTIADLASRTRINEVYSQGATNIDSHQVADNCDTTNPVVIKFHIPTEAVHINKVLLNYDTSAFRAYSKAASSGGGSSITSSSGGSSSQTSSSGGGFSTTSSSGGGQTTSSGGGQTSSYNGGHNHGMPSTESAGSHTHNNSRWTYYVSSSGYHRHELPNPLTYTGGSHSHGNYTTYSTSNHAHSVSNHSHSVSNHSHSVSVGNHSHGVSIPSHTHGVSTPNHTHPLEYGIYNGPSPSSVTVQVDGNTVPGLGLYETEVNVTDYLSRDTGGKITRGFHQITVTPDTLGRVNIAVHVQQFIQSKGAVQL